MIRVKFPYPLFILLFSAVAALILGGAWYIGKERISSDEEILRTKEIGNVIMGVRRLDDELKVPLHQLRILAKSGSVREALDNSSAANLAKMEAAFRDLMAYNGGLYDQVRWIDATGNERVRLNNVDGRPQPAPSDRLQDVSDRYYFRDTMRLPMGQFFISPLDLNVENGKVETPYKPMLRLATPVVNSQGQARGMLILNIAAQKMLTAFTESMLDARDHAMLLNSDGYWLESPNADDTWGFMFHRNDTLGASNPAAWKAISAIPSGQIEAAHDGGLWTWSTAYPLKITDSKLVEDVPHWLVVSHYPGSQLAMMREDAWRTVGTSAVVLLVLFAAIIVMLLRALVDRTRAKVESAQAHAEAQAANRLYEAQKRFRLVVQANANGLLVVDDKGRIEMANPALERMFGYEHDELLGRPMEVLLPEAERGGHERLRAGYMRSPEARPMGAGRDLHGVRKDGSVVPVEISLSSFMEDGRRYIDAVVADISERKQIESRLQRSEAHLRLLLSTNPNGLLVVDEKGRIHMTNPALDAMFGYAPDELVGQPLATLVPDAGANLFAALTEEHARNPAAQTFSREHRLRGRRKDEHTFPIEMSLSSFREDGHIFIQATVMDRSERIAA